MTARSLTLILLLAAFGVACGKVGPPVRVQSRTDPPQAAQPAESSEEESDQKEEKP